MDASNLEDTVDQDFRKLAMNPDQSMNDSAAYDLFLTLSNKRKSKPLKSERCKEPWKVLDSSKFDCERQEDKSNASASYYEENSIIDGPGEKLPTDRADHLREENLDDLMNDIVDLDKEMNLMMKQI